MSRRRIYTDEERKQRQTEAVKRYRNTILGKANKLLHAYNELDRKYHRGVGDLTPEWIVDNILNKSCVHCGESDWHKLGCNRLDNTKPHSKDNVEPCCRECNLGLVGLETKQVYQYTLQGELVKIWKSSMECGRNGFTQSSISQCCNGKLKQHKGYIWSHKPL